MSTNFQSLLAIQVDSIEKPKPIPAGIYAGVLLGYELKEIGKNATPGVTFSIRGTAPISDVDEAAFQEAGGMETLAKRKLEFTFYLTQDSQHRLKTFLTETLDLDGSGKTLEDLLQETTGQAVNFILVQKPSSKDPTEMTSFIDRLVKAD